MRNWSVATDELKKHPLQYKRWQIEQQINFGLQGDKLDRDEVAKHLPYLRLDPDKKQFIQFLLDSA